MATTTTRSRREQLDPQRWERLKSILVDALEAPSQADRHEFVARSCADDIALLREAESLLVEAEAVLKEPTDHLEECAEKAAATLWHDAASQCGKRIGAYTVLSELGRGGMGTVYLAARADGEFQKQVAIKVLNRGPDADELLRRFRAERQILAELDHPNIGRLLDAGTTENGFPYFIMDYVIGAPVTQFVITQRLSIPERLKLFVKICSAVEAAHRKFVVHRDLKTSNIVVTADGEPKLLDFGIAKLLGPIDNAVELTARPQEQRLSAVCASPEQALGAPVTVASDIYALGALLYEMLTGRSPHRFRTTHPSREELARVVCEEEPVLPSRAIATAELQRQLRGDLDQIVQRAMRKDPEQRYQSVAELVEDLQRHWEHRPVLARSNTLSYRLERFAVRNKKVALRSGAIIAAALIVSVSVIFLFVSHPQLQRFLPVASSARVVAPVLEKSIAVLPFQNRSEEKENAFFADGVQDQILTDLAKVADLKVISRTSIEQYRSGATRNLAEIGRQLGVAYVLQGSVQRSANRVRVNTQLVAARTGAQLWAESYERDLADVFAIQTDIAQAIAAQLQAKLSAREKSDIEDRPTRDIEAYDLYLQGKEIVNSHLDAPDPGVSLRKAVRFLDEATQRDPKFVDAYSYAARAHSLLYALTLDPSEARLRLAQTAVENALRLQPNSAEAHLAAADHLFRCYLRLADAQKELEIAGPSMSNSTPFYVLAGNIARRQGRWEEAERHYAKATELDPRNVNAVNYLADTQILMRKFSDALRSYERARVAGLDSPILSVRIAIVQFAVTGRPAQLRAALAAAPPDLDVGGGETPLRILVALADHDSTAATKALAASPRTDFQDVDFSFYYPRSWYEAVISRAQGDSEKAHTAFTTARAILEERVNRMPAARTRAVLAQVYAGLGLKDLALREAREAAARMPVTRDAYDGPLVLQGLAQVYVWSGEKERALEVIEALVTMPGYLSYGYLLVDPAWDPLRGDARFEKLVASLAQNAGHD